MGWDALHPSWLNRGGDVVINRNKTWLCCNSPVFALQFCVSEMTVVATCVYKIGLTIFIKFVIIKIFSQ